MIPAMGGESRVEELVEENLDLAQISANRFNTAALAAICSRIRMNARTT